MNATRSIDKRPQEANERKVVGHWEMDTVYSGKDCSSSCLLTLTERKTRTEITRKIPDRTAASVTAEIDKIERQMGWCSLLIPTVLLNGVPMKTIMELSDDLSRKEMISAWKKRVVS